MLALAPPLAVRLYTDGPDAAGQRLALLVFAFCIAYVWSGVFAKRLVRRPETAQLHLALLFILMLPTPVGWGGVLLAVSFGWIFGREVFGGQAVLPPTVVALAFAVFSFPESGFEMRHILSASPDPLLALACLPGAGWLLWKKTLVWPVAVGAVIGPVIAAWIASPSPELPILDHFVLGTYSIGILFITATRDFAPRTMVAQLLYGALVGALVVLIRHANPEHPDGVAFAVLFGCLFAPLLDRALKWTPRDA